MIGASSSVIFSVDALRSLSFLGSRRAKSNDTKAAAADAETGPMDSAIGTVNKRTSEATVAATADQTTVGPDEDTLQSAADTALAGPD